MPDQQLAFVTYGPLDPESALFVGRQDEIRRAESWLMSARCVGAILGARQTGKTSLLLRLRHLFRDKYATAYIDFQTVEGCDAAQCFRFIADELTGQLAETIQGEVPSPADAREFHAFLRKLAVSSSALRIAVLLDEVGALPVETAIRLASAIRAVFTNRVVNREYAKYVFLLAGASDMLELTTGRNSPLRNVTESIYLEDLSRDEADQLLREGFSGAGLQAGHEIAHQLYGWTSGHPYWHQLLGSALVGSGALPAGRDVSPLVDELVRTEDRNLPHVFKSLHSEDRLWNLAASVLDGVAIDFSRANTAVARLELIGVVKNKEGRCAIRNQIYRKVMQELPDKPPRTVAVQLRVLLQLINSTDHLPTLLQALAEYLQRLFQNRQVAVFIKSRNTFCRAAGTGGELPGLAQELMIGVECQETMHGPFEPSRTDLPDAVQEHFRSLEAVLVVPVWSREELAGFLSLGRKLSDEQYDTPDLDFLTTTAEQLAAVMERIGLRGLEKEGMDASKIQQGLLPNPIPQVCNFQIAGSCQSSRLVGGDYFDVLKVRQDTVAICIADVSGKGMPAALLMANLHGIINFQAQASESPKAVCESTNRLIARTIESGKFITFFYGLLFADSRRIVYTNAGHNYPILLRCSGEVVRLDVGGIILGIAPEWTYEQTEVELFPGDRLLLFTDGLTEAQSANGAEFGEDALIELVRQNRERSPEDLRRLVIEAASNFSGGHFDDDVTILVVAVQ